ncbi:MAG: glycosyltransferase family 4 protein [Thermodesulfobacteriota bacterium]
MKILHADTDDLDNPLAGGQPVRTYEINRRLASHHDIQVLTSVYEGSRDVVREGVAYKRLGLYLKPFGLSPHLSFLARLGPHIAATPHDLVVEEFTPPFGFCLTPFWTPKPVISIVQWYFFEFWEKKYKLPFKRIMKRIARTGRYRYFIVQSDAMGREILSHVPGAQVEKIPCGINRDAFLQNPEYGAFALFLGRLDRRQKGLDLLVRIWAGLSEPVPLVMAGDGPDRSWLESEFAKAGLSGRVTFTGKVRGQEKLRLLGSCRFMVMPSREETFGITALEAMAAAKPVVIFDIQNLNELVTPEWGVLAPPFDADAFTAGVAGLWNDEAACRLKGGSAAAAARAFCWDSLAEKQADFYQKIVKKL